MKRGGAVTRDLYAGWADAYDSWVPAREDLSFWLDLARETGGPVVELGVGTGRVAIPIAGSGVEATGIDTSPSMLAIARKRAAEAGVAHLLRLEEHDMRSLSVDRPGPLVIAPGGSLLHLLTTTDQMATLQRVSRALAPGGRFVASQFLPRPEVMTAHEGRRTTRGSWTDERGRRCEFDEILTHDPAGQRIRVHGIVSVFDDGRQVATREMRMELRWIGRYEMRHLFELAGLRLEAEHGGYAGEPLGPASTEIVWIARKP